MERIVCAKRAIVRALNLLLILAFIICTAAFADQHDPAMSGLFATMAALMGYIQAKLP